MLLASVIHLWRLVAIALLGTAIGGLVTTAAVRIQLGMYPSRRYLVAVTASYAVIAGVLALEQIGRLFAQQPLSWRLPSLSLGAALGAYAAVQFWRGR